MQKLLKDHDEIVASINDEDYMLVQDETHLHCKTCGQEVEMMQCKCGKIGTKGYMEAHIAGRKAKGTASALAAHRVVETTLSNLAVSSVADALDEQYEVVQGARKKVAHRGIPNAPYREAVLKKEKR